MSIDITQDLVDGSDGALGDVPVVPHDAVLKTPREAPVQSTDAADADTQVSLRDQLSTAFKAPVDAAVEPAVGAKPTTVAALTQDAEGRYRQPDGTFAGAEEITAFLATQTAPEADPFANSIRGLTATELQQFNSLPAELRTLVGRTMEDLDKRGQRYAEYDLIEQSVLAPRRQTFANEGLSAAAAVNQLFAMSDFATADPGQFVLWFAGTRGIDLDALLDARDAQTDIADPQVQQLQGQVQQLQGQLTQFSQTQQSEAHQQRLLAVQTFSAEKDASGNPARPYLGEVTTEWAAQISLIRNVNPTMPDAQVLQKAYENACWANPTVRGKLQADMLAAQQRQEQARVAAARSAGSSVTGAPQGTTPNQATQNTSMSLREELEAGFAQARA